METKATNDSSVSDMDMEVPSETKATNDSSVSDVDMEVRIRTLERDLKDTRAILFKVCEQIEISRTAEHHIFHEDRLSAAERTVSQSGNEKSDPEHADRSTVACIESAGSTSVMLLTEQYVISKSVWDSAVFIGLQQTGILGSAVMMFNLALNLIGQTLFCMVVAFVPNSFVNSGPPSAETMRKWRVEVGHHADNVAGESSLVHRVCSKVRGMAVGEPQVELLKDAEAYTANHVGVLLCAFVLIMWLLSMFAEITSALQFLLAILAKPSGATTLVPVDDGYVLESIATGRKAALTFLVTLRLCIAGNLLWWGSCWLCATQAPEDLVLNAAALSVILEFDELIFSQLNSLNAHQLVERTRSMPVPGQRMWRGLGIKDGVSILLLITFLSYFLSADIHATYTSMVSLREAICDSDQDFVWETNINTGLPSWTATKPYVPEKLDTALDELISRHIWPGPQISEGDLYFAKQEQKDISTMLAYSAASSSALFDLFPCIDSPHNGALAKTPERLHMMLHYFFQMQMGRDVNASSCTGSEVQEVCGDAKAGLVRALCPEACGCKSPRSGLVDRMGCSAICESAPRYLSDLHNIPCKDPSSHQLLANPAWQRAMREESHSRFYQQNQICEKFSPRTCTLSSEQAVVNLYHWCPEACGCSATISPECPPSCSQ